MNPETLPYTVHVRLVPHLLKHCLAQLLVFVPVGLGMAVLGAMLAISGPETVYVKRFGVGEVPGPVVGWLCCALGLFVMIGFALGTVRQVNAGPALGATKDGVYLRPALDAKRHLFLRWDQIEGMRFGKLHGPNLCFPPVDKRLEEAFLIQGSGSGVKVAQNRRWKNLGTNLFVPIGGASESPEQILNRLKEWQAATASSR